MGSRKQQLHRRACPVLCPCTSPVQHASLASKQGLHASHRGSILTHTHLGVGREHKKAAALVDRRQTMSLTVAPCLSSEGHRQEAGAIVGACLLVLSRCRVPCARPWGALPVVCCRSTARACQLTRGLLPMLATPGPNGDAVLESAIVAAATAGLVAPRHHVVVLQQVHEDFCVKVGPQESSG